jgi:5-methylcytosine-specific restriction enzyme A
MKFGLLQQQIFGTNAGAYSPVTATEVGDSQITLTDYEAELVVRHFGRGNIHIGNVRSNPAAARKQFILFPTGKPVELNLIYPKPAKTELRLYLRQGFKPAPGDIWFVFEKDGNLHLGSLTEKMWRSLGRDDTEDDQYVSLAAEETLVQPVDPRRVASLQYPRDPKLARQRFEKAKYRCEFNPDHKLFTARATGKEFLEPHHLIMVSLQSRFPTKLDTLENIFALCPWCHRAVHHAERPLVTEIVSTLLERRPHVCSRLSLSTDDVLRLYNCEQITK